MGFPREFAEKCSTIEAFTCAVCDSLVDYRTASYTICSHVFCLSCLSKWLERDRVCPSCRTSLNFNGANTSLSYQCLPLAAFADTSANIARCGSSG